MLLPSTKQADQVRLVTGGITNNERAMQGRLEVQLASGSWSTVCGDGFTNLAASVLCGQVI